MVPPMKTKLAEEVSEQVISKRQKKILVSSSDSSKINNLRKEGWIVVEYFDDVSIKSEKNTIQSGCTHYWDGARTWADLPANAIKYIRRIEELIKAPVSMLSTSPERDDTILVQDPFAD